jgi:hypothetical protein
MPFSGARIRSWTEDLVHSVANDCASLGKVPPVYRLVRQDIPRSYVDLSLKRTRKKTGGQAHIFSWLIAPLFMDVRGICLSFSSPTAPQGAHA